MPKTPELIFNRTLDSLRKLVSSGHGETMTATEVVLATTALVSMGAAVAYFPALLSAAYIFNASNKFSKREMRNAFDHVRRKNYIEKYQGSYRITEKGKKKLIEFDIETMQIPTPRKWDKKWRIVMFDFPIRFKKAREAFRYTLRDLGFKQFQKSTWIVPYPCTDEIEFIADYFAVGKYVDIIEAGKISKNEYWKAQFKL